MAFLKFLFYSALASPHPAEIDEKIITEILLLLGIWIFFSFKAYQCCFGEGCVPNLFLNLYE